MTRGSIDLDVSGIGLRLEGVPADAASHLEGVWAEFLARDPVVPACVVAVEDSGEAMSEGRAMRADFRAEAWGSGARYVRDEGEIRIDDDGSRATLSIGQGDEGRRAWVIVNLVGALLAVVLMRRGGGALHAAGVLLEGRTFLLVGPEGSGKTTFAGIAAAHGALVLSDDVVHVESRGGRLEALGAPIRHRDFPNPGRGRWPVAAILLARRGAPARLDPASRLEVEPRVAANLLYASSTWKASARVGAALEAIVGGAPAYTLTFAPDPSFLDLLRALPR